MNSSEKLLIIILGAVVGLMALCLCAVGITGASLYWVMGGDTAASVEADTASAPTEQIPALEVIGTDLEGRTWTQADLAGKPYVINFWATWCFPCQEELPVMQDLAQKYEGQGVIVLLVNDGESAEQARAYLEENNLTLPSIVDERSSLGRHFKVRGLPTTLMFDASGELKARLLGYTGPDHLQRAFDRIIPNN